MDVIYFNNYTGDIYIMITFKFTSKQKNIKLKAYSK